MHSAQTDKKRKSTMHTTLDLLATTITVLLAVPATYVLYHWTYYALRPEQYNQRHA